MPVVLNTTHHKKNYFEICVVGVVAVTVMDRGLYTEFKCVKKKAGIGVIVNKDGRYRTVLTA